MLQQSESASAFGSTGAPSSPATTRSVFSTGSDSPVSAAWLINRSLASTIRASAGIMSPAIRRNMSPGTTSAMASSRSSERPFAPRRTTQQVLETIFLRESAASAPLDSCTKASKPETITITAMIIALDGSCEPGAASTTSVVSEIPTNTRSTSVKGLAKDRTRRLNGDTEADVSNTLAPYRSRAAFTTSGASPRGLPPSMINAASLECVAACSNTELSPVWTLRTPRPPRMSRSPAVRKPKVSRP